MPDKNKTQLKVAVFCLSARLQCTGADRVAVISCTAEAQVREQGKINFIKARTLSEQQAISWTQEPANGGSSNTKASGGCPEIPCTGLDEHYRQQLGTTSSSGLQTGFHKYTPPSLTADLPPEQDQALSKEIQNLVQKAAIIRTLKTDEFFSPIFIVPKKDGGWRPVINLKALNRYIHTPHFKMESIASVKDVLQSGDYMGKLDLKDAYLSILISEQHRNYLRFQWKKINYEFQMVPFGLASAPRVFTKILRPVAATMRKKGIRLIVYLDDTLVLAQSQTTLKRHVTSVAETLCNLGFTLNHKKSVLEPMQSIEFLGFIVNSLTMSILLSQEKVDKIVKECRHMRHQEWVTPRQLAQLIGLLTSTNNLAVAPAPLHYSALQRLRNKALKNNQGNYDFQPDVQKSQMEIWTGGFT